MHLPMKHTTSRHYYIDSLSRACPKSRIAFATDFRFATGGSSGETLRSRISGSEATAEPHLRAGVSADNTPHSGRRRDAARVASARNLSDARRVRRPEPRKPG